MDNNKRTPAPDPMVLSLHEMLSLCAETNGYATSEECAAMTIDQLESLFFEHKQAHIEPLYMVLD